jgi:hypothetical protein
VAGTGSKGVTPDTEPSPSERGLGEGAAGSPAAGGAPVTPITAEILEKLLSEAKPEEWRYILKLKLSERIAGCGYIYRYGWNIEVLQGEAEIVTIRRKEHYDCTVETDLLVIPKTVPTVVKLLEWDTDPEVGNTETIYIMTEWGWRSVSTKVPGD